MLSTAVEFTMFQIHHLGLISIFVKFKAIIRNVFKNK